MHPGLVLKLNAKTALPVAVLLLGLAVMGAMFAAHQAPVADRSLDAAPLVDTVRVEPQTAVFTVRAQGVVEPRTESELVSEVEGRVLWVSPQLASGEFFGEGEVLARLDSRLYEDALESARAALARAESQLRLARARLEREQSMGKGGATSQAKLDEALHARSSAEAGVREAKVAVSRASYDLERCELRAPFDGRVREQFVHVSEFVHRGEPLAEVYAVDYAEIRLPVADSDFAFLDVSLGYRKHAAKPPAEVSSPSRTEGETEDENDLPVAELPSDASHANDASGASHANAAAAGPEVLLSADFAGMRASWRGRVVRVEGALDPKTRMVNLVVRVDDPYSRSRTSEQPPLVAGLYVEAAIRGKVVEGLFALPRQAVRGRDEILLVDDEDRVSRRRVEVVRAESQAVWVGDGLAAGDRVVVTPLGIVVDGMTVRPQSTPAVQTAAAPGGTP